MLLRFLTNHNFRCNLIKYYLQQSLKRNLRDINKYRSLYLVRQIKTSIKYSKDLRKLIDISQKEINSYYKELRESRLREYVLEQLLIKHRSFAYSYYYSFFYNIFISIDYGHLLYVICRAIEPEVVIETGISDGISSCYILKAMHDSDKGKLFSIDIKDSIAFYDPIQQKHSEHNVGWLIPENLRDRSCFIIGKSLDCLPLLLSKLKSVDLFFHDSDHSYDNMFSEFKLVWSFIREDGLLLAHDVFVNNAFIDFCKINNINFRNKSLFLKLGCIKK